MEGPRARLTLTMDHDKLVSAYRDINPDIDVQKMPISKSVLTFIAKTTKKDQHFARL